MCNAIPQRATIVPTTPGTACPGPVAGEAAAPCHMQRLGAVAGKEPSKES